MPLAGPNSSDPAFSRDGKKLAYTQFTTDTNIWRLDTADPSRVTELIASTQYDSSPQYSPDGSRVVFRSNRSGFHEIWMSDAEGRGASQLTHFAGGLTGTPRWSPDGRRIAFDSRVEGQADIYSIPAGGGPSRRITSAPSEDVVPSWPADGRWVYFSSNRRGGAAAVRHRCAAKWERVAEPCAWLLHPPSRRVEREVMLRRTEVSGPMIWLPRVSRYLQP